MNILQALERNRAAFAAAMEPSAQPTAEPSTATPASAPAPSAPPTPVPPAPPRVGQGVRLPERPTLSTRAHSLDVPPSSRRETPNLAEPPRRDFPQIEAVRYPEPPPAARPAAGRDPVDALLDRLEASARLEPQSMADSGL